MTRQHGGLHGDRLGDRHGEALTHQRPGVQYGMADGGSIVDPAIGVYDGVLSSELCDAIVGLFNGPGRSEYYTGNVGTSEGFVIKPSEKLDTEIDISHSPRALWDGIDLSLLQALLGALHTYATANPGISTPLQIHDEGFRLKRYEPATPGTLPQHHTWHSDAGGGQNTACRMIAAIFYFNDVEARIRIQASLSTHVPIHTRPFARTSCNAL